MQLLKSRTSITVQVVTLFILTSWSVAQKTSAPVQVRDLQVSHSGSETKVEVTLSAPVNPSVQIATKPDRLVLVLPNTLSRAQQQRVAVNDNGIRGVRMGLNSNNPPVTRVVVDLDEARSYALAPDGNKITLTVHPRSAGSLESNATSHGSVLSAQLREPASLQRDLSSGAVNSSPATLMSSTAASASTASAETQAIHETSGVSIKPQPAVKISEASPSATGETKTIAQSQPSYVTLSAAARESNPEAPARPAAAAPAKTSEEVPLRPVSPIPLVTGFMAFQSSFSPGEQHVNPVFDPILLVPLGKKLLVESEFEMSLDAARSEGQWGPAVVDHGIEYLQLNYMAHPNLTITAGRFLTPFGIYRERIHPLWIRNLQEEPIIFAMNENSSNGAMLRGAARLSSGVNLTYATYYSVPTSWKLMTSDRRAGGRGSLVFPNQRLEIGASFSRTLGDVRYNMVGGDVTWNLKRIPLDIRAEGLHNPVLGSGYWVEGAYRLNKLGRNAFLRKSQIVLRGEQYFTPSGAPMSDAAADAAADAMEELPEQNTKRLGLGWNYYLTNGIRLNASWGRNFATGENGNTWGVGVTYRFATF
jgi:AMIN domain